MIDDTLFNFFKEGTHLKFFIMDPIFIVFGSLSEMIAPLKLVQFQNDKIISQLDKENNE